MPIIDAHVHTLPFFGLIAPFEDTGTVKRLLHNMDTYGVDKTVMLPVIYDFSPGNNQECAQWAKEHPDRLVTLTDIAMDQSNAAERVLRAREEFGSVGTSYYPTMPELNWMLEEPCVPLWEAYKSTGLVCNLQLAPPNYGVLLELVKRYPEITFVSNHLGLPGKLDPDDETYGGLMEGAAYPNLFIKATAFYAAAATPWDFRCPQALGFFNRLVKGFGADRILWGTDWPPVERFITYRQALEIVRTCVTDISEADRAKILGENAARVFGI
jgi:L-fuconolactonase